MIQEYSNKIYQFFESKAGHWTVGIIVIINALILGVQTTKWIPEEYAEILHHVDEVILGFFILELAIKIIVSRGEFFRNPWNIFDFLVISASLIHAKDYLPVLRALRTLHLMAMTDALPKTRHIISGLWKSLPGISNVLLILLLFFYIASVMSVFLFGEAGVKGFEHIGVAMKTMFQVLSGDDWSNVMKSVEQQGHPHAWLFFITFYIIMVFIILNLFIGVVVGALQSAEEEIYVDEKQDETMSALLDLKKHIMSLEQKIVNFQKAPAKEISVKPSPKKP